MRSRSPATPLRSLPEVVGVLLLFGLHLALAAPLRGPMLFGDETAYLGIARFLAGHAPYLSLASPAMGAAPFYHFGYPLLLAPVSWIRDDPRLLYRAALALNCGLLALLLLPLASFARRVLAVAPPADWLSALAAVLYPAFLLESNLTWSESLLAPLVVVVIASFCRLVERPSAARASGLALAAVFAYATHARMLGLVPLALLALVLLWRARRLRPPDVLAGVLTAAAALWVVHAVNGAVAARLWNDDPRRLRVSDLATQLFAPGIFTHALLSLVGQLWYLSLASVGLFPLGVWLLVRIARDRQASAERRLGARFTLATALVLIVTSSCFLVRFDRADLAIYGRYAESFLGPFLVAGLAALAPLAWRRWLLGALALAVLPATLAVVLLAGHGGAVFLRIYNELNILGIEPGVLLLGGLRMLRLTALGIGLSLALLALGTRRPRVAPVLVGVLFLCGGLFTYERWLLGANLMGNEATALPGAVAALHAEEVAFDLSSFTLRGFFGYQFWLAEVPFRYFRATREPPPADLVISGKGFDRAHSGARLAFPERHSELALWVMPGPRQEQLARAGRLALPDPLAPLPDSACRSELSWRREETAPLTLRSGAARRLRVHLEHRGADAVWIPADALGSPLGAVRLGARWFPGGSSPPVDGGQRSELPHALAPGEGVDVDLILAARGGGGVPLAPALYEVEIGLVQEGVRWFRDAGDPPLRVPVEVRP